MFNTGGGGGGELNKNCFGCWMLPRRQDERQQAEMFYMQQEVI